MDKLTSRKWWSDVIVRDIKTAASVAVGVIGSSATLGAVDWKLVASTVALTIVTNTLINIAALPDPAEVE